MISVNGNQHDYFKGNKGLRQGNPLSPYLFTLVMKVLSLMIKRNLERDEFSKVSGLVPNLEKSVVFFGNVPSHIKISILKVMPFSEGSLPTRYLGVLLISFRLYKKFCDPLIDKVKQRLYNWKNKVLSFAGRLQLIQSVMCFIQVFWSSVFILYVFVSHESERIMRGFLWSQGNLQRGKAKFDSWCFLGPLCQFISKRDIFKAGLPLNCKVANLVHNDLMKFGYAHNDLYLVLDLMTARPINRSIWCTIQRWYKGWFWKNSIIYAIKIQYLGSLLFVCGNCYLVFALKIIWVIKPRVDYVKFIDRCSSYSGRDSVDVCDPCEDMKGYVEDMKNSYDYSIQGIVPFS
uniref:RNA-directed DNA polymerase, eukaryota, reverse transcriptase zinc-binding domain protein n=1 Tax=Tanacetum cinerariifolium TaxID=118510 RepID=A0A699HSA7_TANCI|nr:hypothetical protein [Tanacetum cinerariifolium]